MHSNIQFYDWHPLLCLILFKFNFIFIFTTWLYRIRYKLGKQCICTHKMHFCLLVVSPKPSESIRNLIELPVCFHPFITYIIFASNQAFLPFHKPIPKTDKYLSQFIGSKVVAPRYPVQAIFSITVSQLILPSNGN